MALGPAAALAADVAHLVGRLADGEVLGQVAALEAFSVSLVVGLCLFLVFVVCCLFGFLGCA